MNTNMIEDIEAVTATSCRVEQETGTAAGLFAPVDHCQVQQIVRAADGAAEYALLRVRVRPGEDDPRRWSRLRRVAVAARAGDIERYIFCGCPVEIQRQAGCESPSDDIAIVRVDGLATALRRCADLVMIGRYARTRAQWSPAGDGDIVSRVGGMECLFSPDSRPNCAAKPIRVRLRDGSQQEIHVFTHDDDPDADEWTVSRAMRYVAWFHLRAHPWLDVESLLAATATSAAAASGGRDSLRASQPMEWALRSPLVGFAAEGHSAVDVISRLATLAGLGSHIEPTGAGGVVRCQVRIWSERSGAARCFQAADPLGGTLPGGGDANRGEVISYAIRRDLSAGVERAIVVGDVKYHEVTVELMPGWVPEPAVDAVPYSQRAAAKGESLSDADIEALGDQVVTHPWYQRYHRKGSAFPTHQDTGRKWILNEHGRYTPELYNRYAPFENYLPYRFTRVLSRQVADPQHWMTRPRRLLSPITHSSSGTAIGPVVEVSVDGGGTWSTYTGPVRILKDECGVVFDANNPREIACPGEPDDNWWYALIDQQARVRVTALIESDERVTATASASGASCWGTGAVIHADRDLRYVSGAGAVNVLRQARLDATDVDSEPDARRMAADAVDVRPGYACEVVLAGIRLDVAIGQRVWGLGPAGTELLHSDSDILPVVRKMTYIHGTRQRTQVRAAT